MRSSLKRSLLASAAAAALLVMGLAGCSDGGNEPTGETTQPATTEATDNGTDGELSGKIAFLMPDRGSTRYEEQDWPHFQAKVAELCPKCETIYQNADAKPDVQQQQVEAIITQGVDVVVIDAVDTTAAAAVVRQMMAEGIRVVTYDRPVPEGGADFYVSFDNEALGVLYAEDLIQHLQATNAPIGNGEGILIVNGSPADDAAMLIKKGAEAGIATGEWPVLAEFDTPDWLPSNAQSWVSEQWTQFGDKIIAVACANDGTASGAIAALKAGGADPLPPVTGNDAEIAAIQRIVAGDQYNTISKPIYIVAEATAEVAVQLLKGETPEPTDTLFDTPSMLFIPEVVTQANVQAVMIDSGIYTYDEICTAEYKAACDALGIK